MFRVVLCASAMAASPPRARWRTAEYALYVSLVAAGAAWLLVRGVQVGAALAAPAGGGAPRLRGLKPAWLPFARRRDGSDAQWGEMRASLGAICALVAAHAALGRLAAAVAPRGGSRRAARTLVRLTLSLGVLGYLHGARAAYPLLLALAGYVAATALAPPREAQAAQGAQAARARKAVAMGVLWALHLAAMLHAYTRRGYAAPPALEALFEYAGLGAFVGGVRDWHGTCYNFQVLRMISFAMDSWAAARGERPRAGRHAAGAFSALVEEPLPLGGSGVGAYGISGAYGLLAYLEYIFYVPLYLAGPIVTFNAFGAQRAAAEGRAATRPLAVARYAARWLLLLLCLEAFTHYLPFNAIATSRGGWDRARVAAGAAPAAALCGFWVLNFMWLKFAVIWRLFRLGALLDGVEAPENMLRWVNDNHDIEGFWKGWHASYNRWLVRYLYIPLGGAKWRLLNVWPIFLFVALWHDLEMRLLSWAGAMALFAAPEFIAKALTRRYLSPVARETLAFRLVRGAAAACYIVVLMAGNLAGFVIGPTSALNAVRDAFWRREGLAFGAASLCWFFALAQIQFEVRAGEARAKDSRAADTMKLV